MEKIKITNSQGQEEEWIEINEDEYIILGCADYNYSIIKRWDKDKGITYYKKLLPKEVYPKVFEGELFGYKVWESDAITKFSLTEAYSDETSMVCVDKKDKEALKQALAESERIQNKTEEKE